MRPLIYFISKYNEGVLNAIQMIEEGTTLFLKGKLWERGPTGSIYF